MTKDARTCNGEKTVSSISGAGKTGVTCKRIKLEHSLTPYTKINSKLTKEQNVKWDTIKLLVENIVRIRFDINCNTIFLDLSPSIMEIKTKIKKWDLIKLKSFCMAKEIINKTKTTYGLGENICKKCYSQGINFQNTQTAHRA